MKRVIHQYKKVLWILNERLDSRELTFIRYSGACEQVFLAALDNFRQWSDITKISGIKPSSKHQEILEGYMKEVNDSLIELEKMALKWGQAVTKAQLANSDINEAVADLEHLNSRIEHYSKF